jgi:carbamoyltransferase
MISWGINALNHGSSLAVFRNDKLMSFDTHNESTLSDDIKFSALKYGAPDRVYWYENPWLKKARQLHAGQFLTALTLKNLPKQYINSINIDYAPIIYTPHHASHASAGYYTSNFKSAAVVVLDAIGEFECASIWHAKGREVKRVWSKKYPHSLGLFYSAFTQLIGLTPIKDEHLLQQMAGQGDPNRYFKDIQRYFKGPVNLRYNLHRGVRNWPREIRNLQTQCDIAAAVQKMFEYQIMEVMRLARNLTRELNLVYMGGCAMNTKANYNIQHDWEGIWSLPDPGDASSAIGAVLYHTKQRVKWEGKQANHIEIKI